MHDRDPVYICHYCTQIRYRNWYQEGKMVLELLYLKCIMVSYFHPSYYSTYFIKPLSICYLR